jgi:hypothetical protein
MGIDIHGFNFIRYASKEKGLGRVATIGRQGLTVPALVAQFGRYCEEFFLKELRATLVDSYDCSDYEGATYIQDMNRPLTREARYDTVIDCGTLEHIYDAPQALKNVSQLCDIGGQIIHVLPANNFCGHGFWQFSPELFFSLYSQTNGYAGTEVFLADLKKPSVWYEVVRPIQGRAEVTSRSPLYVMCRTVKTGDSPHENIQQSDYVQIWNAGAQQTKTKFGAGLRAGIKNHPRLYGYALGVRHAVTSRLQRMLHPTSVGGRNRHLKKHFVSELLSS